MVANNSHKSQKSSLCIFPNPVIRHTETLSQSQHISMYVCFYFKHYKNKGF